MAGPSQKERIAVVGAGVIGLLTAAELSLAGCDVVIFDKSTVGNEDGGSGGIGRIFRLTYPEPEVLPAVIASGELWDELQKRLGVKLRSRVGSLDYGDDLQVSAFADALSDAGCDYQFLTAAEAHDSWPAIELSGQILFQPDGALIHSEIVLEALVSFLTERGAQLRESTPVESLAINDLKVAVSAAGETELFDRAAVCAGGQSGQLCASFFALPLIAVTDEFTLAFDAPTTGAQLPVANDYRQPPIAGESYFWLANPPSRLKLGIFASGPVRASDADRQPDCPDQLADALSRYAADSFCGGGALTAAELTRCSYDNSPDQWFSYSASDCGRVVAVGGFSGHGFKFAPYVGRIAARSLLSADGRRPKELPWSPSLK